jgi:transcriptional regulator with XRE-family HTH domain
MSGRLTSLSLTAILRRVDLLYQAFGQRIKRLRDAQGLSQDALARRVGLRRTSITNIEAGKQHVALHQVYLLAGALDVRPRELLPELDGSTREELLREVEAMAGASGQDFLRRLLSEHKSQPGVNAH